MSPNLTSLLKQLISKVANKFSYLEIGVRCNHRWYGNTYGGFYICPNLINESSVVYSFGIGEDISFDNAVIKNHNCKVFAFDPTPKSIDWVKKQPLSPNFIFYEYGIGERSGFVDFFLPKNPDHVSGSIVSQSNIDVLQKVTVEMKSLEDIMELLGHEHIDVVKMDIEGSEYAVIEKILLSKVSITQILVEFHDRFFKDGSRNSKEIIKMLNLYGYEIFGISDSQQEISFVNKKVLQEREVLKHV